MPEINMVSLQDGSNMLLTTIQKKLTHADYAQVNDIATDYNIYTTGQGAIKKLMRFVPRESEELFAQRIRLTQITTPDIVGACTKPMYKVGRTPATKVIGWTDDQKENEAKKKKLMDVASNFYGKQSVEKYLTYRMVELDATDPNSFIVVEGIVDENDKTIAHPYPFEVSSYEAVNFFYNNNILEWLVVRNDITMFDKDNKEVAGFKYTIYLPVYCIKAVQMDKTMVDAFKQEFNPEIVEGIENIQELQPGKQYLFITKEKGNTNSRYFAVNTYEHTIEETPAIRVGTVRDLYTRGRTRVPLIHNAKAYFDKVIKTISEFDLTNCLHVFPQKIQYSELCPGYMEQDGEDSHLVGCNHGFDPTGERCKACNGSGFQVHKSAMDIIQVAMPRDMKDLVSLENFLVYKHPPTELLEFQKKLALYEFRDLAQRAVYNSELFSQDEVTKTATEKSIDLDTVYDTLKPFSEHYSEVYCFIMRCIAAFQNLSSGFVVEHTFPNDFKMKSTAELLAELKIATENGSSSHIKKAITRDIVRKYYVDDPEEVLRIETKEKYFPFGSKSQQEIAYILANGLCTQESAVLYTHYDQIFADLEFENPEPSFYQLEETKQRKLLETKVLQYMVKINGAVEDSMAAAYNAETALDGNSLLEIQASVADGTTSRDAAIAMLMEIYGFDMATATKLLGKPKPKEAAPAPGATGKKPPVTENDVDA